MKAAETRTITWRGRRITAQVPHPIATQDLGIRGATSTKCASASARLLVAAEIVPTDFANLTHLLARNEALASSYIEGVRAPAIDSVLPALDGVSRSIHDAIATVRFVREAADRDLSVEMLLDWHSRLMRSTPLAPEHIGSFRTEQGWIGGASPIDAALVTPPPEEVARLVNDLVNFTNRTDIDAVLQAAIVHAQFELIHPFADGNGRLGRLLIDWLLCRRLELVAPPGLSTIIARDTGAYLAGLTLFRMGDLDAWVSWFSDVTVRASQHQLSLVQSIEELKARWRARLLTRADACAWSVVGLIPRFPVLDSQLVSTELGLSIRSTLNALHALASCGILQEHCRPIGKGRPPRLFVAPELLALVDVGR
ncbi:MAG: Fic family protein [Ilumatobacteraceae bacterium]|nr:Fic family protein [Ilumatobacteraceae bacterium]